MELSSKQLETRSIALFEGLKYTAAASLFTLGAHFGLQKQAWFAGIPAAPRRILYTCFILGSFSVGSHVSQARHVLENNRNLGL
jgi:hypothetical protein